VSSKVQPIFLTVQEDKAVQQAWYLPVDETLQEDLENRKEMTFDELHLILSADHGQRVFRCNVSAVAISNNKVKFQKHMLVGNIQCKKDTRQLLLESGVAAGINNSIKRVTMIQPLGPICQPCKRGYRGGVLVKRKVTGDLAFYSLALGKDSRSGAHCWRCKARWHRFQDDPF
jgi:hypothetical protein